MNEAVASKIMPLGIFWGGGQSPFRLQNVSALLQFIRGISKSRLSGRYSENAALKKSPSDLMLSGVMVAESAYSFEISE